MGDAVIWGYKQAEEANVLKENELSLLGGAARNKQATPRAWELLLCLSSILLEDYLYFFPWPLILFDLSEFTRHSDHCNQKNLDQKSHTW